MVPEPSPADLIKIPSDVIDIKLGDESLYVIGTREGKVTKIDGLEILRESLSVSVILYQYLSTRLSLTCIKQVLVLRSCLVSTIENVASLVLLTKLELYDNQIEAITGIETLVNLKILDLSFNVIRELGPVSQCPLLEELYVAQNKLRRIEGLESLVHLKILDLGANRIRVIEGLECNTSLKSLWLGKNKIDEIKGLDTLVNLRQLDVQCNRLKSLGDGLSSLRNLSELYLAANEIEDLNGLPVFNLSSEEGSVVDADTGADVVLTNNNLTTIDLSNNKLTSIAGIEVLVELEEFWITRSLLTSYESLAPLSSLKKLNCVYLEHSPIANDFEYRMKLTEMCPTLEQLDATLVRRNT